MSFSVTLPIRVNANARGHTLALAHKVKIHRNAARLAVQAAWRIYAQHKLGAASMLMAGLTVTLVRVAPAELDSHDNLRTAMKPVVDGITDALDVKNDRDERLTWLYAQRRGAPREYAVEVTVEAAT